MRTLNLQQLALTALGFLAVLCLTPHPAQAQLGFTPKRPPGAHHKGSHGHGHGHGHAHGHKHGKKHGGSVRRVPPSPEQKAKRIARIKKRWQLRRTQRAQRRLDRRRAMRRRVNKRLRGTPLTPAMIDEMRTHAHRIARLRRIKFVAAEQDDYETIEKTDRLLARENARNARWWIDISRKIAKQAIKKAETQ